MIVLVLKSNENMEIWHFRLSQLANSSKLCENSLFEDLFKVSAPSFHTSSKSFDKALYGLVDGVLWQIIPYCLQDFLQLVDGIWPGLKCLVTFKHSSLDILNRIKVWWVRWPFVFSNKVTAVGGNPVLSQLRSVSRCSVQLPVLSRDIPVLVHAMSGFSFYRPQKPYPWLQQSINKRVYLIC